MISPGFWWWLFAAGGWGIGLVIHYFGLFGFFGIGSKDWEERELEREISRFEQESWPQLSERTYRGDDYMDLKPQVKRKKLWNDRDLV